MVAGILRPDAGSIVVEQLPVTTGAGPAKRLIGFVPQDIALYPDLTGTENLQFFGRLQNLDGIRLDERIHTVLEIVGLTERAGDRIDDYSGGMKRRANIAVGLLHEPHLLILDEPTVGVDPQSRNQILESIESLRSVGLSVLYTTHYMEEAERLCDRVGIIDAGKIVAEGTRRELVALVGAHDRVRVTVTGDAHAFATRCRSIPGILEVHQVDGELDIVADDAGLVLAPIVEAADADGVAVTGVEVREPDLEAVFLHLTGKALRD
jgi:ABC-2 type transport system ATP-binding protein